MRIQGFRLGGWRLLLAGVIAVVVTVGVVMLSLVALAVGVVVSIAAALALRVRGLLGGKSESPRMRYESAPQDAKVLEVREIQVDEVFVNRESL